MKRKIPLVYKFNEDDFERQLQFCAIMSDRVIKNPDLVFNIYFLNERSFSVNGTLGDISGKSYGTSEEINVFVGIIRDDVVGPFSLPENLSGEMYLDSLENNIDQMLTTLSKIMSVISKTS